MVEDISGIANHLQEWDLRQVLGRYVRMGNGIFCRFKWRGTKRKFLAGMGVESKQ